MVEESGSSAMTASAARPNFAGAGYTLGSNENDSARVAGAAMPVQRQVRKEKHCLAPFVTHAGGGGGCRLFVCIIQ